VVIVNFAFLNRLSGIVSPGIAAGMEERIVILRLVLFVMIRLIIWFLGGILFAVFLRGLQIMAKEFPEVFQNDTWFSR